MEEETYSFQVGLTRPDSSRKGLLKTFRNDVVSDTISSSTLCRKLTLCINPEGRRLRKCSVNEHSPAGEGAFTCYITCHIPLLLLLLLLLVIITTAILHLSSEKRDQIELRAGSGRPAPPCCRRRLRGHRSRDDRNHQRAVAHSLEFDRADVCYLKVKDSAEKFAVLQFGVCPFRWDSSKRSFIAHPHNFYIFPRQELPLAGPAFEFLCQTHRSIS
ncbi:hypothetical protein TB2_028458 [Malus domestica]